ncbi:hypothetical protein ASG78_11320 [Nostocoides sp. Soil756]|nr:hypothetical protein ASG78_11320 [Tetrasphaera sp. Soil756]
MADVADAGVERVLKEWSRHVGQERLDLMHRTLEARHHRPVALIRTSAGAPAGCRTAGHRDLAVRTPTVGVLG